LKKLSLTGVGFDQRDCLEVMQMLQKKEILRCLEKFYIAVPGRVATKELIRVVQCVAAYCPSLISLKTGGALKKVQSLVDLKEVFTKYKLDSDLAWSDEEFEISDF